MHTPLHLSRRGFLAASALGAVAAGCAAPRRAAPPPGRPNVLLIITDDQGYGDLSCHGNPVLRTPALDALHAQSTRLTRFYVCPVCSPTRASLLTGRYHFRTGVIDTYLGRSMMHPDETTLAELLAAQGYRTGIFGKWHLGDHYPMRPIDQGFQEALVHNGGGIAQPSDPEFFARENTYFDPVLQRNGVPEKVPGYCTDIFTAAARDFDAAGDDAPFFCYLALNAPHNPLQVDDAFVAPYRAAGVPEDTARTYAMIANLDQNIGQLLEELRNAGREHNTLVIFMTDNGAVGTPERFNAGRRGWKTMVYEGGIRVPCFLRWPAALEAGVDVDALAAHIDLLPTILAACNAPLPGATLDGINLLPLLHGAQAPDPNRALFLQWHRGDAPEPHRNAAVVTSRYKLVDGRELYDLATDSGEMTDIAAAQSGVVERLRAEYDAWFGEVVTDRTVTPPRIVLGAPQEDPVLLTQQDWRGAEGWAGPQEGYWEVAFAEAGPYAVTLEFAPRKMPVVVHLQIDDLAVEAAVPADTADAVLELRGVPAGPARLHAWVDDAAGQRTGCRYVAVARAR